MQKYRHLWEEHFPEFIHCGEPAIRSLMESATLASIPAGQQIFSLGSECQNYLLLIEGSVKAQLISENGREMFLYQVNAGDSCVLTTSCLLGGNKYPAEAISETEVTAFIISSHAFHRGIDKSTFFREFVFNNFAARLSQVIGRLDDVMFGDIDRRLAKELLLAETKKPIRLTHQQLAAKLGSAREVISRHLKQFEARGWVNLGRGTITITDDSALRKLAQP